MIQKDIETVRELARKVAEIAALPEQAEKIRLWKKLNSLNPERPMLMNSKSSVFIRSRMPPAATRTRRWKELFFYTGRVSVQRM